MTAPPDLDVDQLESIRARAVQGYAPTMRDTLALVAEVERLRDENERLRKENRELWFSPGPGADA